MSPFYLFLALLLFFFPSACFSDSRREVRAAVGSARGPGADRARLHARLYPLFAAVLPLSEVTFNISDCSSSSPDGGRIGTIASDVRRGAAEELEVVAAGDEQIERLVSPVFLEEFSVRFLSTEPVCVSNEQHRRDDLDSGKDGRGLVPLGSYHSTAQLSEFLDSLVLRCPTIMVKFSLGKTQSGIRDMWAMRVTQDVQLDSNPRRPEFKYVGPVHGDETVGRELSLYWLDYLCANYRDRRTAAAGPLSEVELEVSQLIDTTNIVVIPSSNPDGYEMGRRTNFQDKDLNRNFPDLRFPDSSTTPLQAETRNLMNFSVSNSFVLSATFHGGSVVANYAFDGIASRQQVVVPTPDHAFMVYAALTYSRHHLRMHLSKEFRNGITNGAEWYSLFGGYQDWNYLRTGCFDITLELSYVKHVPSVQLDGFWLENKAALFSYARLVHLGVRGVVTDQDTGLPLQATIYVAGNAVATYSDPDKGDYYRLLLPGAYQVTFSAAGYSAQTITLVVPVSQRARAEDAVVRDVVLQPSVYVRHSLTVFHKSNT